jgi:hypothetical protein
MVIRGAHAYACTLAAASGDSAAKAPKDTNNPSAYVNAVGAMQVLARTGMLRRSEAR